LDLNHSSAKLDITRLLQSPSIVLLTGKTGYYPYTWTLYPCPTQSNPYPWLWVSSGIPADTGTWTHLCI